MGKSCSKKRIPTPENIEAQKPASQIQMNEDDKFALFHVVGVLVALAICVLLAVTSCKYQVRFDKRPNITE